jgi:signal transduction histidine kinase
VAQLFYELIVNGIDAASGGGRVEVVLDVARGGSGDACVFEVRDTGPGVPEDLRARIFEPFFTTKPSGKGTGLGLAIAREAAREHGGSVAARYPAEGGAVFTAILPLIGEDPQGLDHSLEEVDP